MNETTISVIRDLAEHPNSSAAEIAGRLSYTPRTILFCLADVRGLLIVSKLRRHNNGVCRGPMPKRYQLRDGIVNWCPHCGHVMERVRP